MFISNNYVIKTIFRPSETYKYYYILTALSRGILGNDTKNLFFPLKESSREF